MDEILIFSGTTEGREFADILDASGIPATVCVATDYGEAVMEPGRLRTVRKGRLNREEMEHLCMGEDGKPRFLAVVDATHPYAVLASRHISLAAEHCGLPYYRLLRDLSEPEGFGEGVSCFQSHADCARALAQTNGTVLLTTGSNELWRYCADEAVRNRLYVRVLPGMESLRLCMEQGLKGKQIIAMQGPFSEELNAALLRQLGICCLVTKESGAAGGYPEKIRAAQSLGVSVFVVENPEYGLRRAPGGNMEKLLACIERLVGKTLVRPKMELTLAGAGMGNPELFTGEVRRAVTEADYLFGAKRLLAAVPERWNTAAVRRPWYLAADILPFLSQERERQPGKKLRAVVLFSGDTGFYSGAKKLYREALSWQEQGIAEVRVCPGISSVSCLAAKLGTSWQDAAVVSLHGADRLHTLMELVKTHRKVFALTSGAADMRRIGEGLLSCGLTGVTVTAGFALSCPEEKILTLTPRESAGLAEEGLYTCLLQNPAAAEWEREDFCLTHGLPDEAFCREEVPMTKEEVREVSVCKLRLSRNAVLYDIGSGTGSVAVEAARLSPEIQVYAVERSEKAAALIRKNCSRFGLTNVTVICGEAPEAFEQLPAATHAFIGGSGGRLGEILQALFRKNPCLRVVINAVTLETIGEITSILKECKAEEQEIVQVAVSRAKQAGSYHLMRAENPVFVAAFRFAGKKQP